MRWPSFARYGLQRGEAVVRRKLRLRVVFDTNVIIGFYLSSNPDSANSRVYNLWRDLRLLELVVSPEIVAEYFEVLDRLDIDELVVERFEHRLRAREPVRQ